MSLDDKGAFHDDETYPAEGDWVLVWGTIRRGPKHPEDVLVEFFSHNEQWAGHVRADRIVPTCEQPEFAIQCVRLHLTANNALRRCVKNDRHSGKHRDDQGTKFSEADVVGYFEEK